MEINRDAQIDTGQVRDVGRSGGGGLGGLGRRPADPDSRRLAWSD